MVINACISAKWPKHVSDWNILISGESFPVEIKKANGGGEDRL